MTRPSRRRWCRPGGSAGLFDAGVVERHIEPAVSVHRDIEGGLHVVGVGDVAADSDGLATFFDDEPSGFGVGLLVGVGDDHCSAVAGERKGGGAADAARGTGDKGNLVGKPAVLVGHDVPFVTAGRE